MGSIVPILLLNLEEMAGKGQQRAYDSAYRAKYRADRARKGFISTASSPNKRAKTSQKQCKKVQKQEK